MKVEQTITAFRMATQAGQALRFFASGRSMWPLLRPGDVAIFRPTTQLRDGDVVLFCAGETLVAHRIIAQLPDGRVRLHGDFTLEEDPPVERSAVLGRLVEIERGSHRLAMDTPLPRLLAAALPVLRVRAPALAHGLRRGLSAAAGLVDRGWTAGPMRRIRRAVAPRFAIAVAGPADAAELEAYDLERGRLRGEYAHLLGGQRELCLLARVGRAIVGCTHVLDPPWTRGAGLAGDLWIHDTWVSRRWRGLGIGDGLTRRAIEEAERRCHAPRLRVAIARENRRSLVLHERLAFRRFGHAGGHLLLERCLLTATG